VGAHLVYHRRRDHDTVERLARRPDRPQTSFSFLGWRILLTTTRERFVSPALFKDRNFLAGNALIFAVGVVLFATLALLPTFLQELLDYPAVTTGLVIAPRGIGSMISL
jgi:hypothetical protein